MRVVHINNDDAPSGGATIAALRIHGGLVNSGLDSTFVCRRKHSDQSPGISFPTGGFKRRLLNFKCKAVNASMKAVLGRAYAINWVTTGMADFVNSLSPDIVHLHWVKADTISIEEVSKIRAKIVWSLHDLWPLLGTESYPSSDAFQKGFSKDSGSPWIERWVWGRKQAAWKAMSPCFVGPSLWAAGQVKLSPIFRNCRTTTIHYPIDCNVFRRSPDPAARDELGVRPGKFILLFGCNMGTAYKIKGFDLLERSLEFLTPQCRASLELVVFGELAATRVLSGVPVRFLGDVRDVRKLARIYSGADAFAFPSRQETFGQTKLEAMSCGLPVVAFNHTGCPEGITHKATGWIAEPAPESFAAGICWLYDTWVRRAEEFAAMRARARLTALDGFTPEAVVRSWEEVYKGVCSK